MKKENFKNLGNFAILIIIVLGIWFLGWWLINTVETVDANRGIFGDKFGFTNSIFSALALAGIIYSILLQQKELNLQRQELSATRDEFIDQNFQTTFFNLLKTQQQIANEIIITISNLKDYKTYSTKTVEGRKIFNVSKNELIRIEKALRRQTYGKHYEWSQYDYEENEPTSETEEYDLTQDRRILYTLHYYNITKENWEYSQNLNPTEMAKFTYAIFFNKFHFAIGHYFRHIYHILNFLEITEIEKSSSKKEIKEKQKILLEFHQFANFVQAQMSTPELFLLFYNSLSFPKLQKLLIKYNLLENLPVEDLLNFEHSKIDGIKLKSRKELLN
jgi:hypothetical protein